MTRIKGVLRHCGFDPNKPGPMKVIADVGDPMYYQQRAIELIRLEEHRSRNPAAVKSLKQAIGLLALAVVELELKGTKPTAPQFPNQATA
jgi:hypothetical protein